jgi:hypothetical protein
MTATGARAGFYSLRRSPPQSLRQPLERRRVAHQADGGREVSLVTQE